MQLTGLSAVQYLEWEGAHGTLGKLKYGIDLSQFLIVCYLYRFLQGDYCKLHKC